MILELEPESTARRSRRSVVTRRVQPRAGMVRLVRAPDGRLVPDVLERLPGRGIWLEARRDLLVDPKTRRALARAAGGAAPDTEALAAEIERGLVQRCLDLLGLAKRGRQAVSGYEKVRDAVREGRAAIVLIARDAGRDAQSAFRHLPEGMLRVVAFDREETGRALGRDQAVYVAVMRGRLARKLLRELRRLSGFRPVEIEGAPEPGEQEPEERVGHE